MMNQYKKTVLSIALGLTVGGIALFGIYTLYRDHVALREVITFLNTQIQQAQAIKNNAPQGGDVTK